MKLFAAFLIALSAHAQNTTTVVGTLSDPFGSIAQKLTATCAFKAGAVFIAASGWTVVGGAAPHSVNITQGRLSVALVPTDTSNPPTYYEMNCHFPRQTLDGRNCDTNTSLVSQNICLVGPGDLGPLYIDVPTSSATVNFKDHYHTSTPTGLTWGQLLSARITWGALLNGK